MIQTFQRIYNSRKPILNVLKKNYLSTRIARTIRNPCFGMLTANTDVFLKQKHKNRIVVIRSRNELDVPRNVQMSQVGIDVLYNGDHVPGDIGKNSCVLYNIQENIELPHWQWFWFNFL